MTLFDPTPYGEERKRRKKPEGLPMIKLRFPWVLARHVTKEPIAHLAFNKFKEHGTNVPMFSPECNHKIALPILTPDGEPLVDVCRQCLSYARKNLIPTETRVRT